MTRWRASQGDTITQASNEYGYRGLNYQLYDRIWHTSPDFSMLTPVDSGWTKGFNAHFRNHDQDFAIVYEGFVDVRQDDKLTFSVATDNWLKLEVNGQLLYETNISGSFALSRTTLSITVYPTRATVPTPASINLIPINGKWISAGRALSSTIFPGRSAYTPFTASYKSTMLLIIR